MNGEMATIYSLVYEEKVVYVGSTSRGLNKRFYQLLNQKTRKLEKNKLRLWINSPEIDISKVLMRPLEVCRHESRYERESFWINNFDTLNNGLNGELPRYISFQIFKSSKPSQSSERIKKFPGRPKGGNNPKGPEHYAFGNAEVMRPAIEASIAIRTGKPLSEEHKAKQRAAAKRNRELRGGPKDDANRLKDPKIIAKRAESIRANRLNRKSNRKIICDQTNETWPCLLDCANHHGVTSTQIYQRMKFKDESRFRRSSKLGKFTFTYA